MRESKRPEVSAICADDSEAEAIRLGEIHDGYRADPSRGRRWSSSNPGNLQIREELARAVLKAVPDIHSGSKLLLDVGCGNGWFLERLINEGLRAERLRGVDLLEERVGDASRRVAGVRVQRADARRLPFAEDSCQLVTLFTVLSLMRGTSDVIAALREARRVSAAGGAIAIWEPRVPSINQATRLVGMRELREGLGPRLEVRSLTVFPPLARRAGPALKLLSRVPALRTHRLVLARVG